MKKTANLEGDYILKKNKERFPDGNLNTLAVGTGILRPTLWNMIYKSKRAWIGFQYAMRICHYLGIDPRSLQYQKDIKFDNKETEYWKERAFRVESENKELKKTIEDFLQKYKEKLPK